MAPLGSAPASNDTTAKKREGRQQRDASEAGEPSLANRTALISGGASGIGLAVAHRMSRAGATGAIVDINASDAAIRNMHALAADLRQANEIDRLAEVLGSTKRLPDLLVLCAGVGVHERLGEGDPSKWRDVLDVNVMSVLRLVRAFLPSMQEADSGGDVVIVSSVAATNPYPYGGVYGASKAALNSIAETLRLEAGPTVRVLRISPGVVDTAFFSNMVSGGPTVQSIGAGALSAEDVAEAIVWAVTRPRHVAVNELVIRPAGQEF